MIVINNKYKCCGCSACAQRCPKQCITLHSDEEGFLYPKVNLDNCIDCGLCEKVCPVLNQTEERLPLEVFAAKNPNEEIRMESSSGGIFTQLAEQIIDTGGVVFGVKWNEHFEAVHAYTDTKEGLAVFRGSKYVQSQVGDTFKQTEHFLKEGRQILYSGTPCQIAALKLFLRKNYENLITVDVVCHGVPSPKIWREYLNSLQILDISSISHKDKTTGWRSYSFSIKNKEGDFIYKERASQNKYLKAFVKNYILRPSCFACPSKAGKSKSDITLADYWGVEKIVPKIHDNKGISFVCINTPKGEKLFNQLNVELIQADYYKSIPFNSCIIKSTTEPNDRQEFWMNYNEKGIKSLLLFQRQNKIIRILKRLI